MNPKLFEELKKTVVKMCGQVEEIISLTSDIVDSYSSKKFEDILAIEEQINHLHLSVDDQCYKFLALQQPMAKDLRFIVAWVRSNSDLERLGDQAINIAQLVGPEFVIHDSIKPYISNMKTSVRKMLTNALDAFLTCNIKKAHLVFETEQLVNELNRKVSRRLIKSIDRDELSAEEGFDNLLIARNLERMGDQITNLAESAIFIEHGADVRHPTLQNLLDENQHLKI